YAIYSDYLQVADIERLKQYLLNEDNFNKNNDGNAFMQTIDLINHIKITLENIDTFKNLENEIIHFKEINAILDENDLKDLKDKIDKIINFGKQEEQVDILYEKVVGKKITQEEFNKEIKKINLNKVEEFQKDQYRIKIKNIKKHYYIPVIIAEDSKEALINHIIKEDSEKIFIEELEKLEDIKDNEVNVDFWYFSKIDQTTDKIYIPYYNKKNNRQDKFYPDFIFWIKKNNDYYIIFVDPKSIEYTDYEYKVDGYSRIFEENEKVKVFHQDGLNIRVYLYLYTKDRNKLSEKYKKYWYDNPKLIFDVINKSGN
ncbi:MAG: hypothetical protein RXO36_05075, partial [Candidatus Nanopusillus acidilobi]